MLGTGHGEFPERSFSKPFDCTEQVDTAGKLAEPGTMGYKAHRE